MEQYTASFARFLMEHVEDLTLYFEEVPEGFLTPSVFFPAEEQTLERFSTQSGCIKYRLYVRFFGKNTKEAHRYASQVSREILRNGYKIPVYEESGEKSSRYFYIKEPFLHVIDDGAVQLDVVFHSYLPFFKEEAKKVEHITVEEK